VAVRLGYGLAPFGVHPLHTAVFVGCLLTQLFFPLVILSYLRIGLLDYRRRCNSTARLAKLAMPVVRDGAVTVAFPLDSPHAVLQWMVLRRLLVGFGVRFSRRIQGYQSQALIVCAAMGAALLAALALYPRDAALVSFACSVLFDLVTMATFVLLCLRYGALANLQGDQHVALLRARHYDATQHVQAAARAGDTASASRWQATADALADAVGLVQSDQGQEPVTIVGIPANFALLQTVAAATVSAATVAARMLVGGSSSSSSSPVP
jgi:hypothetical protein